PRGPRESGRNTVLIGAALCSCVRPKSSVRSGARLTSRTLIVKSCSGSDVGPKWCERRMADHRIWKIVKGPRQANGCRHLHHLRHTDIQTATRYRRLTQTELQEVLGVFDGD